MKLDASRYLNIWLLFVCLLCIVTLINRFVKNRNDWNPKTRDYWYSFFMWSIAGAAMGVENFIRDAPIRVRLITAIAASMVTFIGLRRRGAWGTDNDR